MASAKHGKGEGGDDNLEEHHFGRVDLVWLLVRECFKLDVVLNKKTRLKSFGKKVVIE